MKAINIENVLNFNFIDQPDIENMLESMNQLTQIKALDSDVFNFILLKVVNYLTRKDDGIITIRTLIQ